MNETYSNIQEHSPPSYLAIEVKSEEKDGVKSIEERQLCITSLASLRKLVLCSLDGKLDGKVIGYKGGQALFAQSRNRSCTASKASNHPFWSAQCLRSRVHNETSWKLLGADRKVLTEREREIGRTFLCAVSHHYIKGALTVMQAERLVLLKRGKTRPVLQRNPLTKLNTGSSAMFKK